MAPVWVGDVMAPRVRQHHLIYAIVVVFIVLARTARGGGCNCAPGEFCSGTTCYSCLCAPGSYCPGGSSVVPAGLACPVSYYCLGDAMSPEVCVAAPGFSCAGGSSTPAGKACAEGTWCAGGAAPEQNGKCTIVSNMTVAAVVANLPQLTTADTVFGATNNDPVLKSFNSYALLPTPLIPTLAGGPAQNGWCAADYWNQSEVEALAVNGTLPGL